MFISLFSSLLYWTTRSEKFQALLEQFIVLFSFFIIINGKFFADKIYIVFQMGQNKGISEMFKKPVLQFMALLKNPKAWIA